MADASKSYWFKRKRYGWGWMPVTWQGWLSLLAYIGVVALDVFILGDSEGDVAMPISLFCLVLLTSTATIGWIMHEHAPKPHWRWGKKPDDKPEQDF